MVVLGPPPGTGRHDFRDHGFLPRHRREGFHLLSNPFLFLAVIEDRAAVRGPDIVALAVERCGIMHAEKEVEKRFVAGLGGIEADVHRLGMAFMILVGRVGNRPAGVAHLSGNHARLLPEQFLHAPETPAGQGGQFDLLGLNRGQPEQREVQPITFLGEIRHRDEAQRSRVDAVAEPAFIGGTIIEDMTQMGIGGRGTNFRADHAIRRVLLFLDAARLQRFGKTGPAAA